MRLTKRNVEALLDRYDIDPIGALTTALRRLLEMPDARWDELLRAGPFTGAERARLGHGDDDALDELVGELNENRDLAPLHQRVADDGLGKA